MNILLMPSWYPDYIQTGESKLSSIHGVFILDQIRLLFENGNKVTVLLPKMTGFMRFDKARLGVRKLKEYTEIRFTFPKLFPFSKSGYFYSFNIICIIGFILTRYFMIRQRIDLIHAHILFLSGYSAGILKKIFKIPFILTEHNNPFIISSNINYKLAKKTFIRTDAFIAVSEDLLKTIEKYNFEIPRKFIVGSVVDTSYFCPKKTGTKIPKGKHIFLNISMIHKYKGLIYLLTAVKILVEKGIKNFEVWIGGEGPEKNALINFIEQNKLADYIRFLGLLSRDQVREYFYKTDTFIFPSLNETFGLVLAEAMSCGITPIATINGGSETIITEDTGILIEPKNEFKIADAMLKRITGVLTFNSEVIRQHIIENWGYDSTMKKYMKIWREIGLYA